MEPPRFNHPFEPYDVQVKLMKAIFDCIKDDGVGIFESPTGTGKSLSLICAALTWLRQQRPEELETELEKLLQTDSKTPEWLLKRAVDEKTREYLASWKEVESRLRTLRTLEKSKHLEASDEKLSKRRRNDYEILLDTNEEDRFLVENYDDRHDLAVPASNEFSTITSQLLKQAGMQSGRHKSESAIHQSVKIIYSSRTHSQLTQFVNELKRVHLPPTFVLPSDNTTVTVEKDGEEEIKHVPLASRKNLCIHPQVSRLKSTTAINETCLELQRSSDKKCLYLPSPDTAAAVQTFQDNTLAKIKDIEELHMLGKRLGLCPYYASREVIAPSEVSVL